MAIGGGDVTSTENILSGEYEDPATHEKRSGQILWIRGLTRLQTQVDFLFENELTQQGSRNISDCICCSILFSPCAQLFVDGY